MHHGYHLRASRYNFLVARSVQSAIVFNSNSGAVIEFDGAHATEAAARLAERDLADVCADFDADTIAQLIGGGFVVSSWEAELAQIQLRFKQARDETPMVVTITNTMECNLGCYYCYEERSSDRLEIGDVAAIEAYVESRLAKSGKKSLHVDWYGGEPLLNIEFMENASIRLQNLCARLDVSFHASIVSNGTLWPSDVGDFVRRHRIRQVQISFDGLKRNHDRRRRFVSKEDRQLGRSSFDITVDLVERLLDVVRVDVRFNADKGNVKDLLPFFRFASDRGWFERDYPAVIQPARISAYSERSSFLRKRELPPEHYDEIRTAIRREFGSKATIEEAEAPDGFPLPKTSVCAALSTDSTVFGSDGRHYRCGLQVSEPHRSTSTFRQATIRRIPIVPAQRDSEMRAERNWWREFDPTKLSSCSRCSFLPICWGGCPKKHLEQDLKAIEEQSLYWRRNLSRLVLQGIGRHSLTPIAFDDSAQFRA